MNNQNDTSGTAYIALYATINARAAEELTHIIATRLPENTRTLYLLLCINGGAVSHGFAIYNFLRSLPYKIITHNIANADSIGNIIMLAGAERYATDSSVFLIHGVKSKMDDEKIQYDYIKEKLSCVETDEDRIRKTFLKHTEISESELNDFLDSGKVQDAHYALSKGMIHDIRDIKIADPSRILVIQASAAE